MKKLHNMKDIKITMGICALFEKSLLNLINDAIKEKVDEIIIVTPNPKIDKLIKIYSQRYECNIIKLILEDKRRGKSAAINEILRNASGDIIIMASADVKIEEGAIKNIVQRLLSDENIGAVDSHVSLMNSNNGISNNVAHFTWLIHNLTMIELDSTGRLGHIAGDLYCIRKGIINEIPEDIVNDDAYIAMKIQLSGYRVIHETKSKCYIYGPKNPVDYIIQRSRVLYGHLQLFKLLKKYPTTFEFLLFYKKPQKTLNILKRAIALFRVKGVFTLFIAIITEFLAIVFMLLYYEILGKGSKANIWRVVSSTKDFL